MKVNLTAVIIPCHNEEATIKNVVEEFALLLPDANIYVYDNNSTDKTTLMAKQTPAIVRFCKRIGKGNVVNQMFNEIDADYYIMIDGDHTYDPSEIQSWLYKAKSENFDMIVGKRDFVARKFHNLGNKIFNKIFRLLFGGSFTDIFSGYRIMSKNFVKSFIGQAEGFQIETELSIHSILINAKCIELDVPYKDRPSGSKLSTFKDGIKISYFMLSSFLEFKPFWVTLLLIISSIIFSKILIILLVLCLVINTNYIAKSRIEMRKFFYKYEK